MLEMLTVSGWLVAGLLEVTRSQDTGGFYVGPPSINRESDGQCTDNKGQGIPEGLLFTPGPDECQVCTCLMKMPVLCRTVLCAPPKNCLSLRVGDACCQWICEEWETPRSGANDIGLRLVASAITAVFSLALLFFLIYRLRQRKLRGRQNHMEAESYNSAVGEQEDCWTGGDSQLATFPHGWIKGTSFTRPFPPTYDEAMQTQSCSGEGAAGGGWSEEDTADQEVPAPPYHSINQDPVIPYPVATLGRLVLPPADFGDVSASSSSSRTLPAVLRRMRRTQATGQDRRSEEVEEERQGQIYGTGGTEQRQCRSGPQTACRPHSEEPSSGRNSGEGGAGGQPFGSEEGVVAASPSQRHSYLSQSDFHPVAGPARVEPGRILQTAV